MGNASNARDPLFFGGETAIEYWRWASRRGIRPAPVTGISLESAPDLKHLAESSYNVRALANLRGRLHVYVSDLSCIPGRSFNEPFTVGLPDPRHVPYCPDPAAEDNACRTEYGTISAKMVAHRQSAPLTAGSYCPVAPDVYVAAPALALIQCAEHMPSVLLMQLAYELCGMFAVDPLSPKGYIERLPLADSSSVSSAIAQLAKAGSIKGVGSLKMVSDRLIDGIRCPSAAALCSLFCAPAGSGGYALPTPRAGVPYRLASDEIDNGTPCRILIDLLWTRRLGRSDMDWFDGRSLGVIVCDGGMKSSRRIIELHETTMGCKSIALVCLAASDLQSRATCNSVAKMIRDVVGCKKPKPVEDFGIRNEAIRIHLFDAVSLAS